MNRKAARLIHFVRIWIFIFSVILLIPTFVFLQEWLPFPESEYLLPFQLKDFTTPVLYIFPPERSAKLLNETLRHLPQAESDPPESSPREQETKKTSFVQYNNESSRIENPDVLSPFLESLKDLEDGRREKVRIFHYGDSLIWADRFSGHLKQRFDRRFGSGGRGLVPLWEEPPLKLDGLESFTGGGIRKYRIPYDMFQPAEVEDLGFSGFAVRPATAGTVFSYSLDSSQVASTTLRLLVRNTGSRSLLSRIGMEEGRSIRRNFILDNKKVCEILETEIPATRVVDLSFPEARSERIVLQGIFLEADRGVLYNSIPLAGMHQSWLSAIPEESFFCGLQAVSPDLVILQFGGNEAASISYSFQGFTVDRYEKQLKASYRRIRHALPDVPVLVVGPYEKNKKIKGKNLPDPAWDTVRRLQEKYALESGFAYFDTYAFFGGEGEALRMVADELLLPDGVHLSVEGADALAGGFFHDLMDLHGQKEEEKNAEELKNQEIEKSLQFVHRGYFWKFLDREEHRKFFSQIMVFLSPSYIAFLFFVWIFSGLFTPLPGLRLFFLVFISFLFYASWEVWPVSLLVFSTLLDFFLAKSMESARSRGNKGTIFLILSLAGNLGLLFVFKYSGFFTVLTNRAMNAAGFLTLLPVPEFFLPVGISFYTFQTLSYTIDVYRGKMAAEKSLLRFALFVGFFPQLVAGPIVRAKEFLPTLQKGVRHFQVSYTKFSAGILLILSGLIKKAIADWIGLQVVDGFFAEPTMYGTGRAFLSIYAYGLQIYFDFSGYTNIAIGSAKILGFRLPENFNRPYSSITISDFWRRWHMTLGGWMRDYVYTGLGGGRTSLPRILINLFVTMVLVGLWHGAALNFLLWGAYQGVLLVLERLVGISRWESRNLSLWKRAIMIGVTFQFIEFGWVLFRTTGMENLMEILGVLRSFRFAWTGGDFSLWFFILAIYGLLWTPLRYKKAIEGFWKLRSPVTHAMGVVLVMIFIHRFAASSGAPFIYFQF